MSDVAISDLLTVRPLPGRSGDEHGSPTDVRNRLTHPIVGTVCVILPTYNEAENLRRLVPDLESQLAGLPSQILIIDDASADDTASVAEEFRKLYGNVTLYRRPGKLGLGTALRDGLILALADPTCEKVCTMDADLSHDPAQLGALLDAASGAAFVQGSRYVPGGRIVSWSWHRRLMSWAANRFCRLMGSRLFENTTNYRVYDRRAAAQAVEGTAARGFEWVVLASLAIQAAGISAVEVPIVFKDREAGRTKLTAKLVLDYGIFLIHTLLQARFGWPASRRVTKSA
jgi:dolichol-phosphate mannosyltransferase